VHESAKCYHYISSEVQGDSLQAPLPEKNRLKMFG
jgi:hypothetical protein